MRIRDLLDGLDYQIGATQVLIVVDLLIMLSTTHARFFRPGKRRRADEASQEGATATTPPILRLELLDVHVEFSLELALLLQLFVLRGALWRPEQKVILNLRLSLPAL